MNELVQRKKKLLERSKLALFFQKVADLSTEKCQPFGRWAAFIDVYVSLLTHVKLIFNFHIPALGFSNSELKLSSCTV